MKPLLKSYLDREVVSLTNDNDFFFMYMYFFLKYIIQNLCLQLEGFDRYKYSCRDTSPLSNYVLHPFWNKAVLLCPTWIAPNALTLIGFLCCIGHYLIPTIYDYDFTASAKDSLHPIPNWAWALMSLLLFASHTLDGIDGKQARRTGKCQEIFNY